MERQIVPLLTPRETIEKLAFGPFRQFYEQARSSAKVLFDKIFRKNTEELRRSLYADEGPSEYRGLYKIELDFELECKKILTLRDQE